MIKPYIDGFVRNTQSEKGALLGIENGKMNGSNEHASVVNVATSIFELERHLQIAEKSSAVVFFTSQNCGPCKTLYPLYNKMAETSEGKVVFIMVDISISRDIGMKYSIRATPTFIIFFRGKQEKKWTGSDPNTLKFNFKMLQQLVDSSLPSHPHDSLSLPLLRSHDTGLVFFHKIPSLPKVKAKLGSLAENEVVLRTLEFISTIAVGEPARKKNPDLDALSKFTWSGLSNFSPEILFVVVDIFRVGMIDPDFGKYYSEEKDQKTILSILSYVNSLEDCPYPLRLATLQLCCNLFKTQQFHSHVLGISLSEVTTKLVSSSILDEQNHSVRTAASALVFNITTINQIQRSKNGQDLLSDFQQVELAALIIQAITIETYSSEVLKGFLLSLGNLTFRASRTGELYDLLKSTDAGNTILSKQKIFPSEPLIEEIGRVLLGDGRG